MVRSAAQKRATHLKRQALYDAIKRVREGETVEIRGFPMRALAPTDTGSIIALCKIGSSIVIAHLYDKDARPNWRVYQVWDRARELPFVRPKHIYGVVALPLEETLAELYTRDEQRRRTKK